MPSIQQNNSINLNNNKLDHHHHHQPNRLICSPSLIKEPASTLQSITNTFQSLSLITFASPFRPNQNHHHKLVLSPRSSDFSIIPQPIPSLTSNLVTNSLQNTIPSSNHHQNFIIFSNWFNFNNQRLLLILNQSSISIWNTENLEGLKLIFSSTYHHLLSLISTSTSINSINPQLNQNPRQSEQPPVNPLSSPLSSTLSPHHHHNYEPISASILPSSNNDSHQEIFIAILFNSLINQSNKLIIISSSDLTRIICSIDLPGLAVDLKINLNFLIIATKSPLSLHLFQWSKSSSSSNDYHQASSSFTQILLTKLSCSPITDLTPKPKSPNPVFCLGQSRFLVYASSKPPNEREPPIATGPRFSFSHSNHDHQHRSSPHSDNSTIREYRTSSAGIIQTLNNSENQNFHSRNNHAISNSNGNNSSWKHSLTPNLDAIDETARKLRGGILSGAKLLGSLGQHLFTNKPDHDYPTRQSSPRHSIDKEFGFNFSQSAPVSHMISAYHSHPHQTEETSEIYGNVKILDLFAPLPHSLHRLAQPQPRFHFKIASNALTFLSLSPSSNLLLTSSVEGHSFHIFELRPHSRIGKSSLPPIRRQYSGPQSESTVWHRFKLTRGFTSAEVIDVTWRWDSKVVSVLTEHGTHHLFAIHPAGGLANPLSKADRTSRKAASDPASLVFSIATANPLTFQSLSLPVSAFEKLKPKQLLNRFLPQHASSLPRLSPNFSYPLALSPPPTASIDPFHHHYHPQLTSSEFEITNPFGHHRHRTVLAFIQPHFGGKSMNLNRSDDCNDQVLSECHKRLPSALLFDYVTNSITLYNFEVKKKASNTSTTLSSTSHLAKNSSRVTNSGRQHQNSNNNRTSMVSTPSGLSQLMQQNLDKGHKLDNQELNYSLGSDSIFGCASAVWHLDSVNYALTDINPFYSSTSTVQLMESPHSTQVKLDSTQQNHASENWTWFAEVDTFSQSIRILPRSIYTCHQFEFYDFSSHKLSSNPSFKHAFQHLPNGLSFSEQAFGLCDFGNIKKKKLTVRQEVRIQPGDLGSNSSHYGSRTLEIDSNFVNNSNGEVTESIARESQSGSRAAQIYVEPIRSAVETVLDPLLSSPRSPFYLFPGFPNGHPGKRSGNSAVHPSLMSITRSVTSNVGPVVGVMNERVRKELEKINTMRGGCRSRLSTGSVMDYYSGISESLSQRMGRNYETIGVGNSSEDVTSVSFEDDRDETIQVDRSLFDQEGPSSSSMASSTTFNSSPHLKSDERYGLDSRQSNARFVDEEVDAKADRWDGWTFEDDFDFKPEKSEQQTSKSTVNSKTKSTLNQFEAGWNEPSIDLVCTPDEAFHDHKVIESETKVDLPSKINDRQASVNFDIRSLNHHSESEPTLGSQMVSSSESAPMIILDSKSEEELPNKTGEEIAEVQASEDERLATEEDTSQEKKSIG
ncbi:hypothetical protein O181_033178 [Austropuccinia psidii MF-1]|uniref:BCAS3 WD40 domain-containing protein n=1 Tax=Austropuccinia psidii MF-1 TaxID=1389203 RepID=A0A9Q3H675_9BASI|nr:hypothetical protein [Austropuccinia psidii MF-1]